jgi:hypothetical protein
MFCVSDGLGKTGNSRDFEVGGIARGEWPMAEGQCELTAKNHFGRGIRLQFYLPSLQTKEIEAMNLRRLFKNQFSTLLTQGEPHER